MVEQIAILLLYHDYQDEISFAIDSICPILQIGR